MTRPETPNEIAELLVMLVGRRTAMDLCAIAPSVVEDPPGKRDLHHRLTDITDQVLGSAPTMPIGALIERLEKAVPRLQKALEVLESCNVWDQTTEDLKEGINAEATRPFNNDDPNDGSFKRFTCECGTCIEVTPTWRSTHNDAWWIETFCSEKCGWKARGATLRTWAEDAEKPRG
jgi:hypothetical protein